MVLATEPRVILLDEPLAGMGHAEAARMDLRPRLPDITIRTLIIAGREDPATSPAMAEALHAGIAGSELAMLSPAAHLLAVERPAETADLLRRFISEGTRGDSAREGCRRPARRSSCGCKGTKRSRGHDDTGRLRRGAIRCLLAAA